MYYSIEILTMHIGATLPGAITAEQHHD